MKILRISLFFIVLSTSVQGQSPLPAVLNRFKILIFNDKREILLVKWKGNWEVPGSAYGDTTVVKPISSFLDDLSKDLGISIKQKKLAGMFTYYLDKRTYPMIYSYFTAQ